MVLTVGCGKTTVVQNEYEKALLGKWAYLHDVKTMEAQFKPDGNAKFEGKEYRYTADGEMIHLTGADSEQKNLRYVTNEKNKDQMYVYVQSIYTRQSNSTGIVGVWMCMDKGWTYEFTDKGTFMEDGALTGYYEVNEEAGTVKLIYGEALEDTIFFYQLQGDSLAIEYPWGMQRME